MLATSWESSSGEFMIVEVAGPAPRGTPGRQCCTNHPRRKQDGYQRQASSKFWPGRPEGVRCAAVRKSVLAVGATVTTGQERACAIAALSPRAVRGSGGMLVSAE